MIKVSVMYPNTSGARFDYYRDKHLPDTRGWRGLPPVSPLSTV